MLWACSSLLPWQALPRSLPKELAGVRCVAGEAGCPPLLLDGTEVCSPGHALVAEVLLQSTVPAPFFGEKQCTGCQPGLGHGNGPWWQQACWRGALRAASPSSPSAWHCCTHNGTGGLGLPSWEHFGDVRGSLLPSQPLSLPLYPQHSEGNRGSGSLEVTESNPCHSCGCSTAPRAVERVEKVAPGRLRAAQCPRSSAAR